MTNFNDEYQKILREQNSPFIQDFDKHLFQEIEPKEYFKNHKPLPDSLEYAFECLLNYPQPAKVEWFIDDFEPVGEMMLKELVRYERIIIDDEYILIRYFKHRSK